MTGNLFDLAHRCLMLCDVDAKLAAAAELHQACMAATLERRPLDAIEPIGEAGRPDKPQLVEPRKLPRRSLNSEEGRAALIHAVAHIEFNAINLACDAVYRFQEMPEQYYQDWSRVADEEALHFRLLNERLGELGYRYGDFSAHNGLWMMAVKTADDPLVRMALVPRVLEARGLDVTPGMMERFKAAGDLRTVEILEIILRDEIGHVEIGTRWFHTLCYQRGVEPEQTYFQLLEDYMQNSVRGPFNHEARRQAGFDDDELQRLEALGS